LFDRHLITFDNSEKIILSEKIKFDELKKIGATGVERIQRFNSEHILYLEKHQNVFNSILATR